MSSELIMLTADILSLAPDLASVDMHGVEKSPEKCVLHSANTGTQLHALTCDLYFQGYPSDDK